MAKNPRSALTERILKLAAKNVSHPVNVLSESGFTEKEIVCQLPVPALNLAHSGRLWGEGAGMSYGSHQIVGESKTFKTLFGIIQVSAFLDAHADATAIYLNAEFGANEDYWKACGVDMSRVVEIPIASVEEMMNVVIPILESLTIDEKVIFFTDSVGQLGSKKEMENAMKGEAGKQDFTRAKSLNSFWRLAVPLINLAKVPYLWIGGMYDTTDEYNPVALSGGKKGELGSDSVWLVTKSKNKDKVEGKEVQTGWVFNVKIHKSRFVREGLVIPVCVRYDGGIDRYHGLVEFGRLVGAIEMPRSGWYVRSEDLGFFDEKQVAKSQMTPEWFEALLTNTDFNEMIAKRFQVSKDSLLNPVTENIVGDDEAVSEE